VWTQRQRAGAITIVAIVIASLAIIAWINPAFVADSNRNGAMVNRVKDRLDPNSASVEDLSILPMLGEARAREIVAFRERELSRHPGTIVFEKVEDLGRVKGIGVATARGLEEYLAFPATRPASKPAVLDAR
jgi:hypothetical protein